MREAGVFEAAQHPAPEGAPEPMGSAWPDSGGHPSLKPGVSKGHPLGIIGAAVLTSEGQPGPEGAFLAPGLM